MVQGPGSSRRVCLYPTMPLPAEWPMGRFAVACLLLHSLTLTSTATGLRRETAGCSESCYCSEAADGGRTVRCSNMHLAEVPRDLPNDTRRLYLDGNLLVTIPSDAFAGLGLLSELDLSHNELTHMEPGAFRGLARSLRSLDLSSNRLTTLEPEVLGGLRAQANLTHNPWHCDCRLQVSMPRLDLDPASLAGVVCHTSEPKDAGIDMGVPFVMVAADLDLCGGVKRTTDVAMLVTMFGWFAMVISYLVYYVRHNQEDTRRHLEYLKSLPSKQGGPVETSILSTVV
ncbi:leucine-rich repeat-containing protein 3B [Esox lucius]|uniref:LRRNT domain-containing protein n=1 Tax=Esox lucius TaxID=8010 RepID=A0AAY5KFN6_ESOLU|nr:leucine-rich repeat-containing protein 3B [Esox lucius]XP_019906474.2 leucine-rich repeat-containing protein 3B [Esox lucius]XP_019906475.2 leucine-rich repeat-containing protein 3B [Esox lucius]